ncbi:Cytochrome P450, family 77, subfamily A, polypeptide 4 [Heracleum sosnowskyi]|uniref:Cytochrome P450, family 77, subfamily A, polypeptide 4 n=1 Tax=Heracleum sosnowskyi TaxID=360622 RepID=A0AAD8N4R3_9APIA|nr:Cytochrome P450, family 77, subfamily A, polypeptide 4 [Heracleum sosnowskyi]
MASTISLSSLSSYYHFIFAALALLVSSFIFFSTRKRKLNLPPGPPGWPIVGNLFQFFGSGMPFFMYTRDVLIPNYGPILTIKMGTRTTIIISSADLAREAFIERGQVFASRPKENATRNIFSVNKFTVNSSLYGPVWRSLRRNMVQNMLSATRLKGFRDVRDNAMDKLIHRLKSEADANDGAVRVLKSARYAFFCVLLTMCFGIQLDEEMIEKIDDMMKRVVLIVDPRIDDFLPLFTPFFYRQRKKAIQVRKQQLDLLIPLIKRRKMALQNPGLDKSATSFSYLDTLFELELEGRKTTPTNAQIVTLCSEFLNAATDTTGTAIEWAIAQIIDNPDIQLKLYEEIKSVAGDRKVDENDTQKMPYLNAFCKELLRRHPPTYFSLTHAVLEPTTLGGYDIPPDASVEFYLAGILHDPKIWPNPEKFDPDRFSGGKDDADITGVKDVRLIPFGLGRRICPGLTMASIHVNLMVARMVQEFEWLAYPENSKVDFSPTAEFTIVMKNSLIGKIKPRV